MRMRQKLLILVLYYSADEFRYELQEGPRSQSQVPPAAKAAAWRVCERPNVQESGFPSQTASASSGPDTEEVHERYPGKVGEV